MTWQLASNIWLAFGAGAAARGAAGAAMASSAASSSCGAAVYPSAPSAFSDYEDDKGLRRDGSGNLYKDLLRTDGVAERQWFAEKHAGNRFDLVCRFITHIFYSVSPTPTAAPVLLARPRRVSADIARHVTKSRLNL